jgi:AcrR family transcriptional regulator
MKTSAAVVREGDAPSKRAILESALRLFVRDGLCETTIRAVAADAGFTNPALFKFFEGRDDLARCVFERCYERLASTVALAAVTPGFEPRVRAIVQAATRFMDAELDAFLFVNEQLRRFWPTVGPSLRRQSIVAILRELFALGVQEGKIARDHDTALLVHATIGTLSQFARALYFEDVSGPAVERAPELERLILRIAW